jgi:hypothetical protein
MTAYSGREQRSELRLRPRIEIKYRFDLYDRPARKFNSLLFEHQAKSFTVPFWFDSVQLSSAINAGVASIPCTTYGRAFEEGEPAILWEDYLTNEEVTVDTINANSIDIIGVTSNAYTASAVLLPARYGNIAQVVNYSDPTSKYRSCSVIFYCDPADYSAIEVAWDTFDGHEVFGYWPDRADDLGNSTNRSLDVFDSSFGLRSIFDRTGYPSITKSFKYSFSTQQEILDLKSYLLDADGQRVPFWFFEDTKDLKVTQNVGAADVTIDIDNIALTGTGFGEYRNRICIHTSDGTRYYRKIMNCVEIDDDEERITIDSALGTAYAASQVLLICFMTLGRLSGDEVEIEYDTINHASVTLPIFATYNLGTTTVATTTTTTTSTTTTNTQSSTTSTTTTSSTTTTTVTIAPVVPTWTQHNSSNDSNSWESVCYSEDLDLFVAVASAGTGRIMYSSNGTAWTGVTDLDAYAWYDVCWDSHNGLFWVCGHSDRLAYSSDGINWSTYTMTEVIDGTSLNFNFEAIVAHSDDIEGNGIVLFINSETSGQAGAVYAQKNISGDYNFSWLNRSTYNGPCVAALELFYQAAVIVTTYGVGHTLACSISNSDTPVISGYGTCCRFTPRWIPDNYVWRDICYSSFLDKVLMVSNQNYIGLGDNSGSSWEIITPPNNSQYYCCEYGDYFYVFVALSISSTNNFMYSIDGRNWTQGPDVPVLTYRKVCYSDYQQKFVAVAAGGSGGKVLVGV